MEEREKRPQAPGHAPRPAEAVVKDEKMRRAFEEGFREGLTQMQQVTIWKIEVDFDGTMIYQSTVDTMAQCVQIAERYLNEPGVEVRIWVSQDATELQKAIEEGTIEGEVVEEQSKE